MRKHSNISIFIPHLGCPFNCIFCDQFKITGSDKPVTPSDVYRILDSASKNEKIYKPNTQIAFFGGSFTAIDRKLMESYLNAANGFIGRGGFDSIRISTRPDCVEDEVLELLAAYGVKTIELGIQSFDDQVLRASRRGYTSETAKDACRRIQSKGFELAIQMMCGLPCDTPEKDMETAKTTIELGCRQVRIYPVVVIKGTELHKMYERGEYVPLNVDNAVKICAQLYSLFDGSGVTILKIGLHSASDCVAGPFHPAFGELVRSEVFFNSVKDAINTDKICKITVNPAFLSIAVGNSKHNLKRLGPNVVITADSKVKYGEYKISL